MCGRRRCTTISSWASEETLCSRVGCNDWSRRARLEEACSPHTLRHTFAKNLVDAEVSLDRVAALLGHENLNTTRIYTTPSVHDLTEAVERLEGE